eukprot:1147473-Pelagomonas_calceolata.AAC.5
MWITKDYKKVYSPVLLDRTVSWLIELNFGVKSEIYHGVWTPLQPPPAMLLSVCLQWGLSQEHLVNGMQSKYPTHKPIADPYTSPWRFLADSHGSSRLRLAWPPDLLLLRQQRLHMGDFTEHMCAVLQNKLLLFTPLSTGTKPTCLLA